MSVSNIYISLIAALALAAGCDDMTSEQRASEPSPPWFSSSDEPNAEGANSSEQQLDALSPVRPSAPRAAYTRVEFAENSSYLSDEAKEELTELADSLDKEQPSYLTIRIEDAIEPTEPHASTKVLTEPRAEAVRYYLERQNVKIAEMAVDEAGEIADIGEGRPMARPEPEQADLETQYVVVTVAVDWQKDDQTQN